MFDNRGVGASTGAPANSIEQMADDAITFITARGFAQVDLFGFSMGGMIAQEIALKEPRLVRKMILAGTGPAGGEGISAVAGVANFDLMRGPRHRPGPEAVPVLHPHAGRHRSRQGVPGAAQRAFWRPRQGHRRACLRGAASGARRVGPEEARRLSVIRQQVLVVNGDDDRMVPTPNSRDLALRLPNSSLVIYPDAGHGGVFQYHADFVPRALRFLAR
ncbi:alpha/beta hydrolase [Piscinibacter sp. XHJ-5]|uniref:alpha/beta fold hydrolase n=1 Tax=Piscinibacter sp. XHJ-5 TaxID=3037797 RepID=UPI002452AC1E|nr:alpha/beta hydrolase [Piscinibacter sp. XHJ-5]